MGHVVAGGKSAQSMRTGAYTDVVGAEEIFTGVLALYTTLTKPSRGP